MYSKATTGEGGGVEEVIRRMWREPVLVNLYGARESIPRNRFRHAVYEAWRPGTKNRVVVPARQARNRFLVSLTGLQIRALARHSIRRN
jgi:hypothetical protein